MQAALTAVHEKCRDAAGTKSERVYLSALHAGLVHTITQIYGVAVFRDARSRGRS